MRKQVIEIFSEWMAHYVSTPPCDREGTCRQWIADNYPEASADIVQAVVDSFDQKPNAICSWELTPKRGLTIIVKHEKKTNNLNINEYE